eukprot:EG_transcript_40173
MWCSNVTYRYSLALVLRLRDSYQSFLELTELNAARQVASLAPVSELAQVTHVHSTCTLFTCRILGFVSRLSFASWLEEWKTWVGCMQCSRLSKVNDLGQV